jgi:hypothetical protein
MIATSIKSAQPVGGDPARSFEHSFASLAYTYIQEKAPALLEHMIGFQLIDRTPDETRAAGVFGFDVSGRVVFVPMLFLNKDLKGHEMMYLKDEDIFVPLKENWVNEIINNADDVLGEPESSSLEELGVRHPDLQRFSTAPQMGKYGFDTTRPKLAEWVLPFMPVMAAVMVKNAYGMDKYAGLDDRLATTAPMHEDPEVLSNVWSWYNTVPAFRHQFDQRYGQSEFFKAAQSIKKRLDEAGDVLASPVVKTAVADEPPKKVTILTEKVVMTTLKDPNDPIPIVNDSEKKKILRDGYLVRDSRKGEEFTVAYDIRLSQHFINPPHSGAYEVMFKPFDGRDCFIATNVYSSNGIQTNKCIVYDKKGKHAIEADIDCVLVRQKGNGDNRDEEYGEAFDSLPSSKIEKGGRYVIIAPNGEAIAPFYVTRKLGDETYDIDICGYYSSRKKNRDPVLSTPNDPYMDSDCCSSSGMTLKFSEGNCCVIKNGDRIYVPKDSKVIKTYDAYEVTFISDSNSSKSKKDKEKSEKHHAQLANLKDLDYHINRKMAALKIVDSVDEVVIQDKRMPKLAGLFHLITDFGFSEAGAKDLLKSAAQHGVHKVFIKQARTDLSEAGRGPGAGLSFPTANIQSSGNAHINIPTQTAEQRAEVVPSLESNLTDRDIYNPMTNITPPNELNWPSGVSDVPQNDVFDAAFMQNMLQATRKETIVKQHLPDLVKALDRIARLLVGVWWHSEEFEDWFGKTEINDIEDGLLNVFESLGDVVLELRRKEVSPLGEVADVLSPNLDQVAGN